MLIYIEHFLLADAHKSGDIPHPSFSQENVFCLFLTEFFLCWAGLAPGVHQSGDKTVHGRITRQGNRLVRWVMVQAAQTAVRHDERFREFYERYSGRKDPQKAVVAVAHEMLRIVYFMLKRSESYRGEKRGLSWRKLKRLEQKSIAGLQV
jgi:transposase